jgi:tRNA modification GTPase
MYSDTIVAIATALGESAIGIIRISGHESINIAEKVFKAKSGKTLRSYENRQLVYGHIMDETTVVDEVLVTYMRGPQTYTTEDSVEINCHGGVIPLNQTLKLLVNNGARLAEPGEFTKRAFLNGRLDLAQAESVMDLISAKTPQGFDVAYQQLEGQLSIRVSEIRDIVMGIMAKIEVSIDYPEEDIEEVTYDEVNDELIRAKIAILKLIENAQTGKVLREGLNTVIVGKPNVGKSSLMNALLKESRSIVTDIPGTTRDIIEEHIHIKGIPLKIVDTAGIRDTEDVIERLGVDRSKAWFNKADLIVLVLNAAEALTQEDIAILELIKERNAIVLINKTDLPQIMNMESVMEHISDKVVIRTSIALEHGLDELEERIVEMVYGGEVSVKNESPIISNVRHITALEQAIKSVEDAIAATQKRMPYDFLEVDIKNIFEVLGEITGETIEEDVISKIFSNFCLGK